MEQMEFNLEPKWINGHWPGVGDGVPALGRHLVGVSGLLGTEISVLCNSY